MYTTAEKSAAAMSGNPAKTEPVKLLKRIGSTTYMVNVHFSGKSKEIIEDKLLRLIEREANDIA